MQKRAIVIDAKDVVGIVAQPVNSGEKVWVVEQKRELDVKDTMTTGHKIALYPIKAGELVIKYGIPIGRATQDIEPGEWVHCHNVEDITEELCNMYTKQYREGVI